MKNKKYHNVVTVPKSYEKIAETEAKWDKNQNIPLQLRCRGYNKIEVCIVLVVLIFT
jgi:hypothetical protein